MVVVTLTTSGFATIGGPLTVNDSASITGNLTVDTNTLFVNAADNRVGIGTKILLLG